MRVHEDQIYDMSIKQTDKTVREALVEQRFHSGFQCFFKNYLDRKSITFNQCFYQLIQGSRDIDEVKFSIPRIMKMKGIGVEEKIKLLEAKDHKYVYVFKNDSGQFTTKIIDEMEKDEENIHMLERRLLFYKEKKEKLLASKIEEFRKKKLLTEHQVKIAADDSIPKDDSKFTTSQNSVPTGKIV